MVVSIVKWQQQCGLPRLESRMLLHAAAGWTHAFLVGHGDTVLTPELLAQLNALAARRLKGEPMAYIVGEREFYGRVFKVSPAVLIPRPETELLVEAVLTRLPKQGKLWDLGTGSGAIALTLALERPDAEVRASDVCANALALARENGALLAADLAGKVNWALGSWFDAAPAAEWAAFDVLVSNPPYIEADDAHLSQGDLRFEPAAALTDFGDGLSCIRALAEGGRHYLRAGGWLLIEHGFDQGDAARAILLANGFAEVATLQDWAGLDRITLGRWL